MNIRFWGDVYITNEVSININNELPYVINLEYVYSSKLLEATKEKVNLKSDYPLKKCFGNKLPIAVCLANNHTMDFGIEGLNETLNNLNLEKIKYFGVEKIKNNLNNMLF